MLALLCRDGRVAGRVLLGRPDERRLGALLRPVHDPGRRRRSSCSCAPASSRSRRGRARGGCSSRSCSSRASRRSRFATTSHHRRATQRIGVDTVVAAVRHEPPGTVLFGSTGTSGANFSAFDYGHPANLLDHLVALRVPSLSLCRRRDVRAPRPVPAAARSRDYGLWLFYAASPDETAAAEGRSGREPIDGRLLRGPVAQCRSRRARSCARVCDFGSRGSAQCRSTAASTSSCSPIAARSPARASRTATSAIRGSHRTGRP